MRASVAPPELKAAASAPARPGRVWLVAIGALALFVRLGVLADLLTLPLYRAPQLDGLEFLSWSRWIAAGDFHWPKDPSHSPLYPYLVSALVPAGGLTLVRIVQCAGGALLACLVTVLGARHAGPQAGRAAGVVVALQGPLVWIETSILAEPLLLLLVTAGLVSWTGRAADAAAGAWTGLWIGLAAAARPTALVALVALGLSARAGATKRSWRALAVAAIVCGAIWALPVTLASRAAGGFVPGQAYGGYAFYLGNRAGASGLPDDRAGGSWDEHRHAMERAGTHGVASRDRAYVRAALADMAANPVDAAQRLLRKAGWTLANEEVRDTHSVHFFRTRSRVLTWLPGFGVLLALSVAGLLARPAGRLTRLLAWSAGLFALTCVAAMVGTRYRLPLVPVLAVFAGHGCAWLWPRLCGGGRRGVAAAAVVAVIAVLSYLPRHDASRNPAEELHLSGASLELEDRFAEAERLYGEAVRFAPASSPAWIGLGRGALRRGDRAAALAGFQSAVAAAPGDHRAHHHLGIALREAGEPEAALAAFRQAAGLAPDDWRPQLDAAQSLLGLGRLEEAETAFQAVLTREPSSVEALLGAARCAGARRDAPAGLTAARKAARLAPGDGRAWLLVAALALDAGAKEEAASALDRARALVGIEAAPALEAISARLRSPDPQ